MSINISGCVEKSGEFIIASSCSLREAIELAGGIKNKPPFIPTGVITIKTKDSGKEVKTRKTINFIESPSVLDDEFINDNELLIIQTDGDELLK
jgi:protein involved in polysaccharide export with SLBB domain